MVKKDLGLPPVDTGHRDKVLEYLQFKGSPQVVELCRLKEWVGPVPELREFNLDDQRPGVMFKVVLNQERLACLLEPLSSETVSLWDSTGTGVRSVSLGGDNWRIILGGLDRDPDEPLEEDEDPLPVFNFDDRQSAFDRAMALLEDD